MASGAFAKRSVVVTPAAGGLGLAIARRFAAAGAQAVLADADGAAAGRAAAGLEREGLAVVAAALDARDPAQCRALVDRVADERGALDLWVNCPGPMHAAPAEEWSREAWDGHVSAALAAAFHGAQAAGRQMLKQGRGVIVNVASVDAYQTAEGRVGRTVAHAGLVALTEALGVEWAGRGVRVVGVAPGPLATETAAEAAAACAHRTPLRRLGTIADVADAVLFLAGDEASYITAETMRVDGGWLAYNMF